MTLKAEYPRLRIDDIGATRDALHAYSSILGGWLKSCRPRRKHWWHASLRPSLTGLTTGVVNAGVSFELELDLRNSLLHGQTSDGAEISEPLRGQSAGELAECVKAFLTGSGVDDSYVPNGEHGEIGFSGYGADHAKSMAGALNSVAGAMAKFRAGVPEETSPIQLWPHHFDLSMIWLPGEKIVGQDPTNEEYSDKQMNFGFTFGDAGIPEPYFYVSAYPSSDGFADLQLPAGARWQTDGFTGAVLPYRLLLESDDPTACLLDLWTGLLSTGRELILEGQRQ